MKCKKLVKNVSQSPGWHPQMSRFVHSPKIFHLFSQKMEENRKYSYLRCWNQRILSFHAQKMTVMWKMALKCNLLRCFCFVVSCSSFVLCPSTSYRVYVTLHHFVTTCHVVFIDIFCPSCYVFLYHFCPISLTSFTFSLSYLSC